MRNFLKLIFVIQTKYRDTNTHGKMLYRLNPFNPVIIPLSLILAFFLFGALGMWKEIDFRNPFKWK